MESVKVKKWGGEKQDGGGGEVAIVMRGGRE